MPNLTNEILEFFSIDTSGQSSVEKQIPKSIDDFVSQPQYLNTLNLHQFAKIINILKNEGILMSGGILPNGNVPISNEILIAPSYDAAVAQYGIAF